MPNIDFYYKRSRLNQLKGFCSVIQNDCCIAKASKKTNVAADTISKQVRTLERDLKILLFERTKHHTLTLTPEGKLFYDKAIMHLNGMNSLFENFHKDLKEFNDKHLNIALYYTASAYIFPKILGEMIKLKEFKDLEITIYVISKEEAVKKLINKEIDLAFYIVDTRDIIPVEIETIKSFESKMFLLMNKDNQLAKNNNITRKDIENSNFLQRDSNFKNNVSSYFNTKKNKIEFKNASLDIITEAIKYTNNITIIPELYIKNSKIIKDSNLIIKNIDNLFSKPAYFNIIKLKNSIMKNSANWLIEKLKSLK